MIRTDIYIDNTKIDLFEDTPLPLNYVIADIRSPESRDANYSKTIRIPGSKENNKLFTHIFDIHYDIQTSGTTNFTPDFNPNLKAEVIILVDRVEQFKGIIKLDKINVLDKDKIEYECTCFGKLANIFANLEDTKLTDLDFSEFDHTYTYANQKASWSATVGSGYVYPMIDYGYTDGTKYNVEHFYPAIYAKTYLDKIFSYAGFQYDSNFFNSERFKRLIIPFNSDALKLNETDIANRTFRCSLTTNQNNLLVVQGAAQNFQVNFDDDTTSPNTDAGNMYSTATFLCSINNTGDYFISANLNIALQYEPTAPDTQIGPIQVISKLVRRLVSGTEVVIGSFSTLIKTNGTLSSGTLSSTRNVILSSPQTGVRLNSGEKVFVQHQVTYDTNAFSGGSGDIYLRTIAGSYFYDAVINKTITEGDTVSMNRCVPSEIKAKDFFSSIIKMFNLYIEEDKNTLNKLKIETRNDFYTSGTTVDWSDKLDISRPLEIIPMGELDSKRYLFTYQDDTDYLNEKYKKEYGETYGQEYVDVTNDFIKGVKETKIIFAPTPLAEIVPTDRIIPEIKAVDQNGVIKPKSSKIRILYYGGVKSTSYSWQYLTSSGGFFTETTYPYAGHLDDTTTPDFDLNFGVPKKVFYTATSYTDNNLYNIYYSPFINEIIDRNSKIVTGYFYLTPADIHQLDFRNKFYFEKDFFRLNKIYDYDPISNDVTKCEFIKIKDGTPYIPTRTVTVGAPRKPFGAKSGQALPTFDFSVGVGDSTPIKPVRGKMIGSGNALNDTAIGILVTGDGNNIHQDTSNINLLASSGNTIIGGISNVTLINTSGVTVTQSNSVYINGQLFTSGVTATNKLTKGGDSDGASLYAGTNDNQDFNLESSGITRLGIKKDGRIAIGTGAYSGFSSVEITSNTDQLIGLTVTGADNYGLVVSNNTNLSGRYSGFFTQSGNGPCFFATHTTSLVQNITNPSNEFRRTVSSFGAFTVTGDLFRINEVSNTTSNIVRVMKQGVDRFVIDTSGRTFIGDGPFVNSGMLEVGGTSGIFEGIRSRSTSATAIFGTNTSSGVGVSGSSDSGNGLSGTSTSGAGVSAFSTSGRGVTSFSSSNYAGFFQSLTAEALVCTSSSNTAFYAVAGSNRTAGQFDGNTATCILSTTTNGTSLRARQSDTLSASSSNPVVQVQRLASLGAFDLTGYVLDVVDTTAATGGLFRVQKQSADKFVISNNGSVGIGIPSPTSQLHTSGTVRFENLSGVGTRMVVADSTGALSTSLESSGVTGTGVVNYIPKWDGTGSITTSIIQQSSTGNNIGINVAPEVKLQVRGNAATSGVVFFQDDDNSSASPNILTLENKSSTLGRETGLLLKNENINTARLYSKRDGAIAGDGHLTIQTRTNSGDLEDSLRIKNKIISIRAGGSTGVQSNVGAKLFDFTDDAGNVGTSETDLYSTSLPANLFIEGAGYEVIAKYYGIFEVTPGTVNKRLRAYIDSNLIFDSSTLTGNGNWSLEVHIIAEGSDTVKCFVGFTAIGASTQHLNTYTRLFAIVPFANSLPLKITGTSTGASAASNDIVAKFASGHWFPNI